MKKKRQSNINSNNTDNESHELSEISINDFNPDPFISNKKQKVVSSKECSRRDLGAEYKISDPKKIYENFFTELDSNIENIKKTYNELFLLLQDKENHYNSILRISPYTTYEFNAITNLKSLAEKPLNTLIDNKKEFFDENINSDNIKHLFFNVLLPQVNNALKDQEQLINQIDIYFSKFNFTGYILAFEIKSIYDKKISNINSLKSSNFNEVKNFYTNIAENIKKNIEHMSRCNAEIKKDIFSVVPDKKLKFNNTQELIIKKKIIDDLVIETLSVLLKCFKESFLAFADFDESKIYEKLDSSLFNLKEKLIKINKNLQYQVDCNNLSLLADNSIKNSALTFSSSSLSPNYTNNFNSASSTNYPPIITSNDCKLDLTPTSIASSISNTPRDKHDLYIDSLFLPNQITLENNSEDFEGILMRSSILTPPFNSNDNDNNIDNNKEIPKTVLFICNNLNNDTTYPLLTLTPPITIYQDEQLDNNNNATLRYL